MNVDQIRSDLCTPDRAVVTQMRACAGACVCLCRGRYGNERLYVWDDSPPARATPLSSTPSSLSSMDVGRLLSPTSMEASENYPVSCWGQQTCRRNHRYKRRSYLQQRAVKKGDKIIWGRRDSLALFMIKELWNHDLFSAGGFKPTVLLVSTFRLRESCFNILLWTDVMI